MPWKTIGTAALLVAIAGCAASDRMTNWMDNHVGTQVARMAPAPNHLPPGAPGHPRTEAAIVAADISARDKALADDYFQGRGPGTERGEQAAQWIADEMARIGLAPGNNGSYFQNVPSVTISLDPAQSSMRIEGKGWAHDYKFPDEAVWWTPQYANADVKVDKASLVFVGYGVVAPEYNWNDYAGVDVKGKVVVVLINDPGFLTGDTTMFKGRAMTYYGRWVYKYEEAARQGAAGVIIVHETEPAAYGWQVVRNSNSGGKSWLDVPDSNASRVSFQSWITYDMAKELFARAGMDYDKVKIEANHRGFKARPMKGLTLSAAMHSTVTKMTTRNVIGVLKGTTHPDDYVLYTAHWDHLGIKPDVAGDDKIYNGAVDNGMGTASILEIAEAFTRGPRPQRSVAFVSVTLEEQGLLGSEYFAAHPVFPLNHIVGGINLDANLPEGKAHDMIIIGNAASELEDLLEVDLRAHGRVISGDPEPEKGGFYRSDHISLAKVGVPMLDPAGGYDLVNGGKAAGQAARDDYRTNRYHQPTDEFNPNWDLSGPVDDLEILAGLGHTLANSESWPNWYKDNEFRAIRDRSMAERH